MIYIYAGKFLLLGTSNAKYHQFFERSFDYTLWQSLMTNRARDGQTRLDTV